MGQVIMAGIVPKLTAPTIGRLPSGYTEVEYVQSATNGEYIDTGFKPNQDSRIVITMRPNFDSTDWAIPCGACNSTEITMTVHWFLITSGVELISQYGAEWISAVIDSVFTADDKYTLEWNKNIPTVSGYNGTFVLTDAESSNTIAENAYSANYHEFSIDYPLYLFAQNSEGSPYQGDTGVSIYSCQIYDNGTLVRDFVPCISDADGVGLYDLVEGKFYGNMGSGTLFAGEVV